MAEYFYKLFGLIKSFYFDSLAAKIGIPDCHYLMKHYNTVKLIRKYNVSFSSLLDVGCANGLHSIQIVKLLKFDNVLVEGFDTNIKSINYANHLSQKLIKSNFNYYTQNINTLTLSNKYDFVLILDSLQYSSNIDSFFKYLQNHLLPDCMIILYVPLKDNLQIRLPRFIKAKIPTYNHNYPKMDELNIIFKKYNLKTIDYKWVGGTLIRSYMSIKYYIKTKLKYLTYFLIPFDYFFAFLDLYPKNFGYGMFFVLKYTS